MLPARNDDKRYDYYSNRCERQSQASSRIPFPLSSWRAWVHPEWIGHQSYLLFCILCFHPHQTALGVLTGMIESARWYAASLFSGHCPRLRLASDLVLPRPTTRSRFNRDPIIGMRPRQRLALSHLHSDTCLAPNPSKMIHVRLRVSDARVLCLRSEETPLDAQGMPLDSPGQSLNQI